MEGNSADQHINGRARNACLATFVTGTRSFFIIFRVQEGVGKSPKIGEQSLELGFIPKP